MAKLSKKQRAVADKYEAEKLYPVAEAMKVVKDVNLTKFDASVDLAIRLGVDPRKANQMVRGVVSLPHGTGKSKTVLVFCTPDKEEEAKAAGADHVGMDELVEKIQGGWLDFDVAVATPNVMAKIGRIARILGPRGLMPNPKTGTVTPDIEKVIKELVGGRLEFRNDKFGLVHTIFGKLSFGQDKLTENLETMIKTIEDAKPSGQKGIYIKKITINSTMGAGIQINLGNDEE